ncbi:MAG: class I SAM-dependent methyltransferase [Chloroflexota bacterium]
MSAALSTFDRQQARYWEQDTSYLPPRSPTAVASASPKLDYVQGVLRLPRDTSVLDVGAGNGVFTHQLRARFNWVACLDGAWNMIARNPSAGPRLQGSAYHLPFAAGSFDLVFCGNLLHHLAEPKRAVAEMTRLSREHVVLCEPNRWNLPLLAFMALVPEEHGGLKFSPAYLRGLAEAADLKVLRCQPMGLVYERKTPALLLPLLRGFDRPCWFGAYTVLIARKRHEAP